MSETILIVDDEPRFIRLLDANLVSEGYSVIVANNGLEAIDQVVNNSPSLVLMDIMMPKMDGLTALQRIREFSNIPIVMLTAKGKESDRILGLDRGADDYIVKPFSADVLIARVKAVMRRAQVSDDSGRTIKFQHGDLSINFAKASVTTNDEPVFLSTTEYKLLLQFAQNVGKVVSADSLLTNVWGEEYKDDKEILWVCISRLRQKLEENPKKPEHIKTKSGLGYIMPILN